MARRRFDLKVEVQVLWDSFCFLVRSTFVKRRRAIPTLGSRQAPCHESPPSRRTKQPSLRFGCTKATYYASARCSWHTVIRNLRRLRTAALPTVRTKREGACPHAPDLRRLRTAALPTVRTKREGAYPHAPDLRRLRTAALPGSAWRGAKSVPSAPRGRPPWLVLPSSVTRRS